MCCIKEYKIGPSTLPWTTPAFIEHCWVVLVVCFFSVTKKLYDVRYDFGILS